jgi:hypothetical protein
MHAAPRTFQGGEPNFAARQGLQAPGGKSHGGRCCKLSVCVSHGLQKYVTVQYCQVNHTSKEVLPITLFASVRSGSDWKQVPFSNLIFDMPPALTQGRQHAMHQVAGAYRDAITAAVRQRRGGPLSAPSTSQPSSRGLLSTSLASPPSTPHALSSPVGLLSQSRKRHRWPRPSWGTCATCGVRLSLCVTQ